MDWKQIPYTKKIIKKQCKFAKINFKSIDFDKSDWFMNLSWTFKESDKFEKWLIRYLKWHKKARLEILKYPSLNSKQDLERAYQSWVFMYGFPLKREL